MEITPAPDIAARVEGIIGIKGLAPMIKAKEEGRTRQELAFEIVKDVCSSEMFKSKTLEERLTIATRVGLAVLTEGIVVASTEGIQKVELHKNPDGSDYAAIVYAGPIRGAGGTGAALSVAMADFARKLLNVSPYKAQQTEIERTIEEIQIYHSRIARLQYYPSEQDMRTILEKCEVCIDGLPTEKIEVAIHRNIKRLDRDGKEEMINNKVRGGIGLVVCEGIAQKAKSVMKHTKNAGLDWSWLNSVIKVEKQAANEESKDKSSTTFLKDLVAGRPILAYPDKAGSFRLRYGRSRFTGIASKGFSPATMILLGGFIAIGTQLRVEKPGKGCIATPVDSIEGPFVKLKSGEAIRVNSAEVALNIKDEVVRIISVGDILATYGDFKKANNQLAPPSYCEEYWYEHLIGAGYEGSMPSPSFIEAYELSKRLNVPMHPSYIYEFNDISLDELKLLYNSIRASNILPSTQSLFSIESIVLQKDSKREIVKVLEKLCVPHFEHEDNVSISKESAQALVACLGLENAGILDIKKNITISNEMSVLENINASANFKIMRRSTRIGARIGRPEKAKERLMKPSPNVLFPIGESGGKERNLIKAYLVKKKSFGNSIDVEMARYRCSVGKEITYVPFCNNHNSFASLEYMCRNCGKLCAPKKCQFCGGISEPSNVRKFDIVNALETSARNVGMPLPKLMKGVKGLMNENKSAEPIEKGIIRAAMNIHIFKDGTSRFDATDVPITHFYPKEMGIGVERLRELGYRKDFNGNELKDDTQLIEMRHQDVILNKDGAEHMLKVTKFIDELLIRYYKAEPFYNAKSVDDLIGHLVITLSPHTSAGVLCRIIGFTDAYVGFAHPYVISARRRNCDGDEDTTMMLLDALINFSKSYLPVTIGGTMDAPLILTLNVNPSEVDDEAHEMEVTRRFDIDFYKACEEKKYPSDVKVETVKSRLKTGNEYDALEFTHLSGIDAIRYAPKRSAYTQFKTMSEKIEAQFKLIDTIDCVDKADSAKRLILSHFIPDLIGNMHSFSKQMFRCVACNAKYRRVPLVGKCTRCSGKIVLTISKSSIEKYLTTATNLANRYDIEPYIKQRIILIKEEIDNIFSAQSEQDGSKQFSLASFM